MNRFMCFMRTADKIIQVKYYWIMIGNLFDRNWINVMDKYFGSNWPIRYS